MNPVPLLKLLLLRRISPRPALKSSLNGGSFGLPLLPPKKFFEHILKKRNKSPRPRAALYECHGKCGQWLPPDKFFRRNNKSGRVYANLCRVCQRREVSIWIREFYESLNSDDPIRVLRLLDHFDRIRPSPGREIGRFIRWKHAKNSLLARLRMITPLGYEKEVYQMAAHHKWKISLAEAQVLVDRWKAENGIVSNSDNRNNPI